MNKKGQSPILIIILIAIIIAGVYYFFLGDQVGIEVSCGDTEIIGIKKIPPPVMSIVPEPTVCMVDLIVGLPDKTVICHQKKYELESQKGVIECKNLEDYLRRNDVFIKATFYDKEETKTGDDLEQIANLNAIN